MSSSLPNAADVRAVVDFSVIHGFGPFVVRAVAFGHRLDPEVARYAASVFGENTFMSFLDEVCRLGHLDVVASLLTHGSAFVRRSATNRLQKLGSRRYVPALEGLLHDPNSWVITSAKDALSAIARDGERPDLTPTAVELQPLDETIICVIARRALDPRLVPQLELLAGGPLDPLQRLARSALRRGRQHVNVPRPEPNDASDIEHLRFVGQMEDEEAIDYLAEAVAGRITVSVPSITYALTQFPSDRSAGLLFELLAQTAPETKEVVRTALLKLRTFSGKQMSYYYERDSRIRRSESDLLVDLLGRDAIHLLVERLENRWREIRDDAETRLLRFGAVAVEHLRPLLERDDSETRVRALRLIYHASAARSVGSELAAHARSNIAAERRVAVVALAQCNDETTFSLVVDALASPDWKTRAAAAYALHERAGAGEPANLRALDALAAALGDSRFEVRNLGVWALLTIARTQEDHTARAVEILIGLLAADGVAQIESILNVLQTSGDDGQLERAAAVATAETKKRLLGILEARRRERAHPSTQAPIQQPSRVVPVLWPLIAGIIDDRISLSRPMPHEPARESESDRTTTIDLSRPLTEAAYVSVTGPATIAGGAAAVLEIWVHLAGQRAEVIARARQARAGRPLTIHSRGPVRLETGVTVHVVLRVASLGIIQEDDMYWNGDIGNCTIPIQTEPDARRGSHVGSVDFLNGGLCIARLHFELEIANQSTSHRDLTTRLRLFSSAFASYATEDREQVFGRIQGILKIAPQLDIFLDVISLRSGDKWEERIEQEIAQREVFYLFWSRAATQSKWVEWEWRTALRTKGLDHIDPVPLDSPRDAPPPQELTGLHFNDWTLSVKPA
jgi:hypothetical protein